jgi:hypothetical protein
MLRELKRSPPVADGKIGLFKGVFRTSLQLPLERTLLHIPDQVIGPGAKLNLFLFSPPVRLSREITPLIFCICRGADQSQADQKNQHQAEVFSCFLFDDFIFHFPSLLCRFFVSDTSKIRIIPPKTAARQLYTASPPFTGFALGQIKMGNQSAGDRHENP